MNPKAKALQAVKAIPKLAKPMVAPKPKPQLSQRDTYAKAMNSAMRKGGSNGIGVGY